MNIPAKNSTHTACCGESSMTDAAAALQASDDASTPGAPL
jgi:hypothetical protein